mmetsp:Transcript_23234/g.54792  ORF Transcript_23234/g.54792 Transcript_23234/m.54792 type:complete len:926 (+) Transcript_23234:203-2980(+)
MATHQRILTKDRRRKKTGRSSLDSHNSSKPDRDGWFTAADKSEVEIVLDLLPPPKKAKNHKRKRIHESSDSSDDGGGGSDASRDAWGNKFPSKVSTRKIINKVNKRSKKRRQLLASESEESNDDDEDNNVVFVAKKTSRGGKSRRMDKESRGKAKGSKLKPSESKKTQSKSGHIGRRNLARLRRSIDSAGERHTELSHNASTGRGHQFPAKAAREADRMTLPGSIDTVDQLVWYRMVLQCKPDEYEARYKLIPCRILEGDEAERQRSNLQAGSNLTIVQFLNRRDPSKGKYRAISRDVLINFAKKSPDRISYTFNDEYLNRYLRQQPSSEHNQESEKTYLLGLYRHAVAEERLARQLAEKERQAFYGSSSEESEAKVRTKKVAAKKKTTKKDAAIATKSRKKDVQFELVEVKQGESEQDEESDQDDDTMDIPYTQAMNYDSDEFDFGSEDEKSNEPLRPGDVIEYYSGIYVAGDPRGLRRATVMAVKNPKEEFPLVLDNGECIPNTTRVKRIKEMVDGELIEHPGIYRSIMKFRMKKSGTATAADGVAKEAERFGRIMDRNMAKLKKKAEADGFAPMDMLVGVKGTKKGTNTSNRPNETSSSSSEQESSSSSEDSSSDESLDAKLKARSQKKRPVKFLPKKKKSLNKENNMSKPSSKTDRNRKSRDDLSFASSSADEFAANKSRRAAQPRSADTVDLSMSESDVAPQSTDVTSLQRTRRKATLDDSSSSDDESSLETPKQRKASPTGTSTDSIKRRIQKGAPRGSSTRRARESQSSTKSSFSRLSRPNSPPSSDDSLSLRALSRRSSARKHRSGSKVKPGKNSAGTLKSKPSPTIDLSSDDSDDESECSIPRGIAFSGKKENSPARKQAPSRRELNSASKSPPGKKQKAASKPENSKPSDDDSDTGDFGMTQKSFGLSLKINRNK